jgi:membrane-bound ClpP family serine protease
MPEAPSTTTSFSAISQPRKKEVVMIALGVVLIVLGLLFPTVHILFTIGIVLLVIGAVLWILGSVGRPVAGRRYWY